MPMFRRTFCSSRAITSPLLMGSSSPRSDPLNLLGLIIGVADILGGRVGGIDFEKSTMFLQFDLLIFVVVRNRRALGAMNLRLALATFAQTLDFAIDIDDHLFSAVHRFHLRAFV